MTFIKMESYTIQQRVQIVELFYENQRSVKNVFRKLRDFYGLHNRPSERTIGRIVQKFQDTGSVEDKKREKYSRSGRSLEHIVVVRESVHEEPEMSISRRSQQLGLSESTTWRILHKDLALKAYKVQITQELKPLDHLKRRSFVNFINEQPADFSQKIMFSDEAHFELGGYVNKQNCRIWGEENPRIIHEKPMHPKRVTVWCALWSGGVIGPYFFENAAGEAVTVNGVRYREMLSEFLWPELDNIDLDDIWFQQDGATPHFANETITLLRTKFPGRIIARNGDVNWPPRSCDLTPLDYFLWGYVKSQVYKNNPQSIPELKDEIIRVIGEIEPQLCQNVIENFNKRVDVCGAARGGHLADIVFRV